ncbi:hypothetical protein SVEN_2418, partial [Streptomyces venezuelae ATCC 10712]
PSPSAPHTGRPERLASADQLRAQGIPAGEVAARCRPGGWQQLLPGVFLLQPGTPTSEDRLRAALALRPQDRDRPPPRAPTR